MKKLIKKLFEKFKFLKPILFYYRKLRLLVFSYLKLPKEVKVLDKNNKVIAVFNTRDFATANVCQYYLKQDILDYEPEQKFAFLEMAKNSKIVFDIGTQIGFYAILAAKLGAEKVVAIDIDKEFLKIAQKQAKLNNVEDKIEFLRYAIGVDGNLIEVENYNGISKVDSISLDTLCKIKNIYPDLIKIDIEGWELEAFENAKDLLKKKPKILLALHPDFIRQRNKDPKNVLKILFENNYKIKALTLSSDELVDRNNMEKFLKFPTIDFACF